ESLIKSVRILIKSEEIRVTKDLYFKYHDENNTLKELILKFLTKMQAILISNKIIKKKKKIQSEKKLKHNKSDINISDNSNINKSEDKALSDNEAAIKSKENFFNVLQNITKNMIKEVNK